MYSSVEQFWTWFSGVLEANRRELAEGQERRIQRRRRRKIMVRLLKRLQRKEVNRSCMSMPELLLPEANHYWESVVPLFSDERFQKKFRVSRPTFQILVNELGATIGKSDTQMRRCIPVGKRIAICLFVLKTNSNMDMIADLFGVGRSTVAALMSEFCDAVNEILFDVYVKYPKTHAQKLLVAEGFYQRWQFPGCFGSIDGTHIPIIAPPEYAADYFNYKHFHSLVLLGVVDYNYKFIYVNIGRPGRVNDATIFADSGLKRELNNNVPHIDLHLVGDGAFPLSNYLMKPYLITNNMPLERENFNARLSRARVTVEDAFGRLKGRWRFLMKRADYSLFNMKKIIKTCVVLHNLCEDQRDPYHPHWQERVVEFDHQFPQPNQVLRNNIPALMTAQVKRDRLARQVLGDEVVLEVQ